MQNPKPMLLILVGNISIVYINKIPLYIVIDNLEIAAKTILIKFYQHDSDIIHSSGIFNNINIKDINAMHNTRNFITNNRF